MVKPIPANEAHVTQGLLDAVRSVRSTGEITAFEALVRDKKLLVFADGVWNLVKTITVKEDKKMTFWYSQYWRPEKDNRLTEIVAHVDSFESKALAIKGPALPETGRVLPPDLAEMVDDIRRRLLPPGFLGTRQEEVWVRATMADTRPGLNGSGRMIFVGLNGGWGYLEKVENQSDLNDLDELVQV